MLNIKSTLKNEIKKFLHVKDCEIFKLKKLGGSNHAHSFIVNKQKYVIRKFIDKTIFNWEHEKAVYISFL